MTALTIDSTTLKTVRKARKLGRPRLARMTGLTERQIARLETAASAQSPLPQDSLTRLAEALQIPAEALTGALPLIDEDLQPASQTRCTNGCCG